MVKRLDIQKLLFHAQNVENLNFLGEHFKYTQGQGSTSSIPKEHLWSPQQWLGTTVIEHHTQEYHILEYHILEYHILEYHILECLSKKLQLFQFCIFFCGVIETSGHCHLRVDRATIFLIYLEFLVSLYLSANPAKFQEVYLQILLLICLIAI